MGGGASGNRKAQAGQSGGSGYVRGSIAPSTGVVISGSKLQKRLHKKFQELRKERPVKQFESEARIDGLASMPEFVMHPLLSRIIQLTELQLNKETFSFIQFFKIVRIFSQEANYEEKAHFLFKLYDFKGQEKIDTEDMMEVYGTYLYDGAHWNDEDVHCQIPEDVLRPMIDRYIDMHDQDQDGGLNLEEFMNALGEGDVHYLMNVSLF